MQGRRMLGHGLTRREFLLASVGAGAGLMFSGGCSSSGGQQAGVVNAWGWDIAAASLREVVPLFGKQDSGVKVKVESVGRLDLYDKATTGFAAGGVGLPDVLQLESDRLSGYVQVFPQGIANLSELGAQEYKDKIAANKWPQAELDGEIYAFPWDIGPAGVFYRVDFFDRAGVKPNDIETWDDFMDAGKEIKSSTGKQLLGISMVDDDSLFRMMLNLQGTYYFDEEGRVALNSPEAVRAMDQIRRMNDAGLIVNVQGPTGGITAFKNERVAAITAGVWQSGLITSQAPEQEGKWYAFLLPAFEKGGNRAANLGGSNLVINASSPDLESSYEYAAFAMTDPGAQMYMMENYGLFPSLLETYDNPFFDKRVAYFDDKPIYKLFTEEVPKIPAAYYTDDYARALERSVDAQNQVLLNDGDPEAALTTAAEQLAGETKRELAGG